MFIRKPSRHQLFFLGIAAFYILLSSELVLNFYEYLPLIKYVRLNGEFRIFGLLCLVITGLMQLEKNWQEDDKLWNLLLGIWQWVVIMAMVVAAASLLMKGTGVTFSSPGLTLRDQLKALIHSFSWREALILQGTIHLILLWALKSRRTSLVSIAAADLAIAMLLSLPFTGVGRTTLREIDMMISKSPAGVRAPYTIPESAVVAEYPATEKFIGGWGFYSKQAALPENLYYPLYLRSNEEYFAKWHKPLMQKPFQFLSSQGRAEPLSNSFSRYEMEVQAASRDTLAIKQNMFSGWQARVDGKMVTPIQVHDALVGVPLDAGLHRVEVWYYNQLIRILLWAHWLMMGALMIWLGRAYLMKYILP
jgi:hypothetical protein